MLTDSQGTKRRRNIAENFNRLSRVHERYRRQTDGRRLRGFTFAKNIMLCVNCLMQTLMDTPGRDSQREALRALLKTLLKNQSGVRLTVVCQ